MRIHICAVGRLRTGPEADLLNDYLTRFDRTGRALGLTLGEIREVEDKKGKGMSAEAELLARAIPDGAMVVAMDERGQVLSSPDFAGKLSNRSTSRFARRLKSPLSGARVKRRSGRRGWTSLPPSARTSPRV